MLIGNQGISSVNVSSVSKAYTKNARPSAASRPNDSVEVSASASMFTRALETARNTPDIRADRVEQLRQEIAEGRYQRDPATIAQNIIADNR